MRRFFPGWGLVVMLALGVLLPGLAWAGEDTAPAGGERRVALVIGNGAYRNVPALANPAHDAELVSQTLAKLGFTLIGGGPVLDADKSAMESAIREFGRALEGGAVGLFYYSGHGIQVGGVNYLIPVSADIAREADVKYELVDISYVLEEMTDAGNRLNIVILDACRNNPFGKRGTRGMAAGLGQMTAPAGTVIAYATQPDSVAADGAGQNSPYTAALAKSLQKPGMDIFGVFNDVGLDVKQSTNGLQQPWVSASPIEGQFYFAGAPAAQPAQPAADPDALFWEQVKSSSNSADLADYLKRFPEGQFAGLAKRKLLAMCDSLATPSAEPAQKQAAMAACQALPGDPRADYLLATNLQAAGRLAEAAAAYRRSAEQDYGAAAAALAALYDGNALGQNAAEAVKWYQKAAGQGIAAAQLALGVHYSKGTGVARDEAEAVRWYKKAADQGLVDAQLSLGIAYGSGQGIARDDAEAARWYKKAADQGVAAAQLRLGEAYGEGTGVAHDDAEAARWYKKAAELGDPKAQYDLGWCYQFGQGLPADSQAAVQWYRKAAAQGVARAKDALANLTGTRE